MQSIMERIDGPALLAWLGDDAAKGAVVLCFALLLATLMRRASSSARYLTLFLGTIGLLLLPALSAILPGWHILPNLLPPSPVAVARSSDPAPALPAPLIIEPKKDEQLLPVYTPPQAVVVMPALPLPVPNHQPPMAPSASVQVPWQWWVLLA